MYCSVISKESRTLLGILEISEFRYNTLRGRLKRQLGVISPNESVYLVLGKTQEQLQDSCTGLRCSDCAGSSCIQEDKYEGKIINLLDDHIRIDVSYGSTGKTLYCNILCKIRGKVLGVLRVEEFRNGKLIGVLEERDGDIHNRQSVWVQLGDSDSEKYEGLIDLSADDMVYLSVETSGDKRRYLRAPVNSKMKVVISDGSSVYQERLLIDNISFGGIALISDNVYSIGSEVILNLVLIREHVFTGKILYIRDLGNGDYYYGIEFSPFRSTSLEDVLYTFIEERLR